MNIIDIIILTILAVSTLYGFYRGFIRTAGSLVGGIVAMFLSFSFAPVLAAYLGAQPLIDSWLGNLTDALARVGDSTLASERVASMSQSVRDTVLKSVNLPDEISQILKSNLSSTSLSSSGLETVNDYVSNTLISVSINVICFLIVFALCYMVINLIISLIHNVFKFPVLRQLDWLAGGLIGLIRGGLLVYLAMLVLPLIEAIVPKETMDSLLNGSNLSGYFQSLWLFIKAAAN